MAVCTNIILKKKKYLKCLNTMVVTVKYITYTIIFLILIKFWIHFRKHCPGNFPKISVFGIVANNSPTPRRGRSEKRGWWDKRKRRGGKQNSKTKWHCLGAWCDIVARQNIVRIRNKTIYVWRWRLTRFSIPIRSLE